MHYRQIKKYGVVKSVYSNSERRPAIIEGNIAKIPLGIGAKHGYAIVDKEFSYLDRYNWHINNANSHKNSYAQRNSGRHQISLHHDIMKKKLGFYIDHISGDTYDNRKSNLRYATQEQNAQNAKIASNNTTGYKGVVYHKVNKYFCASITIKNKSHHIGVFPTAIEAAKAYNKRALELRGEFARLNNV